MGKNMENQQFSLFFALFRGFEYIFKYEDMVIVCNMLIKICQYQSVARVSS